MPHDKWLYPDDEQLMTLEATFPDEDVAAIDGAVKRFHHLKDREDFVFWAVQYALESLKEQAEDESDLDDTAVAAGPDQGEMGRFSHILIQQSGETEKSGSATVSPLFRTI